MAASPFAQDLMAAKLVFIETVDVVETTLALDNFRRACDCGRGAVFLSVARGKARRGEHIVRVALAAAGRRSGMDACACVGASSCAARAFALACALHGCPCLMR
jgi:hypothetical protein